MLKIRKSLNFRRRLTAGCCAAYKNLKDLDFGIPILNAIGYSFVRNKDDIILLQEELKKRLGDKARRMAIIAKIETRDSVSNLPEIIVQAASLPTLAS